jgi:hypothetical protein
VTIAGIGQPVDLLARCHPSGRLTKKIRLTCLKLLKAIIELSRIVPLELTAIV